MTRLSLRAPSISPTSSRPEIRSLFVRTATLLEEERFREALLFVAGKKDMGRYANMIDFLFCELISGIKTLCKKYYSGDGEPLSQLSQVNPKKVALWDVYMAVSLHVAEEAMRQNASLSWAEFRAATLAAMESVENTDAGGT